MTFLDEAHLSSSHFPPSGPGGGVICHNGNITSVTNAFFFFLHPTIISRSRPDVIAGGMQEASVILYCRVVRPSLRSQLRVSMS